LTLRRCGPRPLFDFYPLWCAVNTAFSWNLFKGCSFQFFRRLSSFSLGAPLLKPLCNGRTCSQSGPFLVSANNFRRDVFPFVVFLFVHRPSRFSGTRGGTAIGPAERVFLSPFHQCQSPIWTFAVPVWFPTGVVNASSPRSSS